jgi:hypothetical protein
MRVSRFGYFLVIAACIIACRPESKTNIPDVSDIDVDIDLTRFEQVLLKDTTINAAEIQQISSQYPAFSEVYFNHIIPGAEDPILNDDPELKIQNIQAWVKHPRTRWLYDTVQQIFPQVEDFKNGLKNAFTYAKYYFPEKPTPRFFTTVSDFGYFPFVYAEDSLRDGIGISLEMFLGENFPYRKFNGLNDAFSDYLIRSYNKDHMVKRTLDVWIDDIAGPPPGNRLLDIMIHNGKKLYIEQSLMPETPDTVIMDYPSVKMNWVKKHEREIWDQFATQNLLYETSLNKIQKLVGLAPSSPGMPQESPGNTGSYIGWQIVKAYMRKHPETTMQQLLALDDAQVFLKESGYKPPR